MFSSRNLVFPHLGAVRVGACATDPTSFLASPRAPVSFFGGRIHSGWRNIAAGAPASHSITPAEEVPMGGAMRHAPSWRRGEVQSLQLQQKARAVAIAENH